jgi:hypothetical protein
MGCSFKHKGEFIPSISSIKILDKKNETGFLVQLLEENGDQGLACDGCKELEVPLCIQYCEKREDLETILKEFLEKKRPGEKARKRTGKVR